MAAVTITAVATPTPPNYPLGSDGTFDLTGNFVGMTNSNFWILAKKGGNSVTPDSTRTWARIFIDSKTKTDAKLTLHTTPSNTNTNSTNTNPGNPLTSGLIVDPTLVPPLDIFGADGVVIVITTPDNPDPNLPAASSQFTAVTYVTFVAIVGGP